MRTFPFPDKMESQEELSRDILFYKIDPALKERITSRAWDIGVAAMEGLVREYPGKSIWDIIDAKGLKIVHEPKDNVAGNVRFFSEYYSGKKIIILYDKSVRLWARANRLRVRDAEELILSHEMFHHLECTELGPTSDIYQVPWIEIGVLSIGKCGIRALSEIGAHGFSRTYYDVTGRFPREPYDDPEEIFDAAEQNMPAGNGRLKNHALNEHELLSSRGLRGLSDNVLFRMISGKKR